jgi:hypothetical protein
MQAGKKPSAAVRPDRKMFVRGRPFDGCQNRESSWQTNDNSLSREKCDEGPVKNTYVPSLSICVHTRVRHDKRQDDMMYENDSI